MLDPRSFIQNVPHYHPPLAGRNGLRLDFNENTVGCSPRVLSRLQRLTADDLARYPEREPVEAHVAALLGIDRSELLLTNGVDEAIHLLCQTYLDPGDEALIVVPTYSMYRIYAAAAGANAQSVLSGANFEFPTEKVLQALSSRTRLVAIANPNNPTGGVAPREDLLRIARTALNGAVLVDEAYYEFYGETLLDQCSTVPNLFVTRTFSKAYGLAGLRVGVLAGSRDAMSLLRRVCSPYNVNAVALGCLSEALSDQEYIRRYVGETIESRARLERTLAELGIQFWPSQGNFVLFRVGATQQDSAAFTDQMRQRGILVRDRSGDPGCVGCVRITLGSHDHTHRLLSVLHELLSRMPSAHGVTQT